jgi:hypothetical protein
MRMKDECEVIVFFPVTLPVPVQVAVPVAVTRTRFEGAGYIQRV